MGKKIVGLYSLMCVLSFVLITISCFNKWHQVTFKTLGFKTVMRMETTLTVVTIPASSKLFCGIFKDKQPNRCAEMQDGTPLQEAASDWCAPMIFTIYPGPCIAFNRAYILGMAVILTYGLNIIFLFSSAFLLYYYLGSKSHKPTYRTWAAILHGMATGLLIAAVICYTIFAMTAMDAIGGSGIPGLFEASESVGISPGYFLVWVGILLQLVALGFHACMRLSSEETEDQRLYKDMLKEQQSYGALEAQAAMMEASYPPGYGDAGMQYGYAGDAGAQYGDAGAQYGYAAGAPPMGTPLPMAPAPAMPAPAPAMPNMPAPGQAAW
ncbi:unnamed protein product [Effrenium voratum]|uniref:Uncharacterized protein n=1 Tax=Effrenium voratum TaxID=2562239 RepID=A0AA36N2C9_9DINO|nr:unnamed protein product [Effrenium voratum]CAJ1431854.1 unnamed protein product [Effrenium voratum]